MNFRKRNMFFIELPYWLGSAADALWALGLFVPSVFGLLTGNPDFDPDLSVRLIMGMAGFPFACWTLLLLWAVRQPINRRFVILLTAFITVGMFGIALTGYLDGNATNLWIIIKTIVLFVTMVTSYFLAGKMEKQDKV